MTTLTDALFALSTTANIAGMLLFILNWRKPHTPNVVYGMWALANLTACVANTLTGSTVWAVIEGVMTVVWAWLWWRGRGKGRMKKAARALGEKSKARVRRLAARLDRSPVPVPGGAS